MPRPKKSKSSEFNLENQSLSGSASKTPKVKPADYGDDLPKEIVVDSLFNTDKLENYEYQRVGQYFNKGQRKVVYRLLRKK